MRISLLAALLIVAGSLVLPSGCSSQNDDDVRVIPETGVNLQPVSYRPAPNPTEFRVSVPNVTVGTREILPTRLAVLESQKPGFPIEFHGMIQGIPGGIVTARFFRKGIRTPDGRRLVTNEFGGTMKAKNDSMSCEYSIRGKTPVSAETHDVEIVVSYPDISVPRKEGALPKLSKRVIATGELSTDAD